MKKGSTREVESILPLTLNGINKPLKNYTIYGNTLQNGTPTPENPVEVQAVELQHLKIFLMLKVFLQKLHLIISMYRVNLIEKILKISVLLL